MKKLLLLVLVLLIPAYAAAEDPATPPAETDGGQNFNLALPDDVSANADLDFSNFINDITRTETPVASEQHSLERIQNEFWYVVILACLSVISLLIVLHYLKLRPESTPKDFVSASGLSLIVFGTIILVLIVDTSEQLTAAIGILGAIAGYLFRTAQEGGQERRLARGEEE